MKHDDASGRIEDALIARADQTERVAIVDGPSGESLTYSDLARWAMEFARTLITQGLAPGDRVALFHDKTLESVAAFYGTWMAGGVTVPVNGTLRSAQIRHIVEHSGARYFVSTERKLASLKSDVFGDAKVLSVPGRGQSQTSQDLPATPRAEGTLAAILYTSGSTGLPKGIAISHQNLTAGARIVSGYLEIREVERILSVLPFSFDYGLNQLLTAVRQGATLVLQRSPLAADVWRSLDRHEITALAGVPPLWIQLAESPSAPQVPSLRYLTNSGGALPPTVVAKLRVLLPQARVFLMYGLTEAFRSTFLPPELIDVRPTSMGKAIPDCDVLVVSEEGTVCAPGEVGELIHAGPTVSLEYWKDPEATRAKFRPHPFRPGSVAVYSGDYVRADDEGFLYFVGRRDEQIKTNGYRVSPNEVEAIIYASRFVAEVVIKSEPDPVAGTVLVAHCVPLEGFSVAHLLEYCTKEMPSYMVPRRVQVHKAFQRTSSGKIDRKAVG